ncbi:MAG: glycosyltransferase family 4 protein [Acidobacteriota bacterium]
MSKYGVLLIENSIGLSGSAISLCTLATNLDDRNYLATIAFSRVEQLAYFEKNFSRSIQAAVIRCQESLKTTWWGKVADRWAARIPSVFGRAIHGVISLLDLAFVIVPYVARLYRYARGKKIDLIHHNNGFDVAAILLACLMRLPIVAYQRGAEWNSPMVRFFSRLVKCYVANSERTKLDLLAIGVPPHKIVVIFPPIDLSRFNWAIEPSSQRQEFRIKESDRCFGIVGTLLEWKGHRVFLKAAARVMQVLPDARAFIIGGAPDGSTSYEAELRSMAQSLGISERVVFTGFREDIPQLIQTQQVIVHTSLTPEPFGRVLTEAMAMKKPVVASKAGGPLEIIEDGVSGFLVEPGDEAQLAERILMLLTDLRLALGMGERGYQEVKRRFSVESHVPQVEAVYSAALGLSRGA